MIDEMLDQFDISGSGDQLMAAKVSPLARLPGCPTPMPPPLVVATARARAAPCNKHSHTLPRQESLLGCTPKLAAVGTVGPWYRGRRRGARAGRIAIGRAPAAAHAPPKQSCAIRIRPINHHGMVAAPAAARPAASSGLTPPLRGDVPWQVTEQFKSTMPKGTTMATVGMPAPMPPDRVPPDRGTGLTSSQRSNDTNWSRSSLRSDSSERTVWSPPRSPASTDRPDLSPIRFAPSPSPLPRQSMFVPKPGASPPAGRRSAGPQLHTAVKAAAAAFERDPTAGNASPLPPPRRSSPATSPKLSPKHSPKSPKVPWRSGVPPSSPLAPLTSQHLPATYEQPAAALAGAGSAAAGPGPPPRPSLSHAGPLNSPGPPPRPSLAHIGEGPPPARRGKPSPGPLSGLAESGAEQSFGIPTYEAPPPTLVAAAASGPAPEPDYEYSALSAAAGALGNGHNRASAGSAEGLYVVPNAEAMYVEPNTARAPEPSVRDGPARSAAASGPGPAANTAPKAATATSALLDWEPDAAGGDEDGDGYCDLIGSDGRVLAGDEDFEPAPAREARGAQPTAPSPSASPQGARRVSKSTPPYIPPPGFGASSPSAGPGAGGSNAPPRGPSRLARAPAFLRD